MLISDNSCSVEFEDSSLIEPKASIVASYYRRLFLLFGTPKISLAEHGK